MPPKKKRPEDIDPQHILNQARSFLGAYAMLRNPISVDGKMVWYASAACSVGAFALELLLKYLLALERKFVRGADAHNASALFDHLSPEVQARLARELNTRSGREQIEPAGVRAELASLDGLFEQWRYVYEYESAQASLAELDGALAVVEAVARVSEARNS